MRFSPNHRRLADWLAWLFAGLVLLPHASRADTVASLLGNFTVNQYCGLRLEVGAVGVHYAVVFGQLPALRELHLADANGDGVTTQAERDAYVQRLAPGIADQLQLIVDGEPVPLHAKHWTSSLPTEQGGFSLRLDVDFSGTVPVARDTRSHTLRFTNRNYAGQFGWTEIEVQSPRSISVFDTDAFSTSLTAGLTQALRTLPAEGPLAERSIHLSFVNGPAPSAVALLQPRPGTAVNARQTAASMPGNNDSAWLQRQTRSLIGLISTPHVAPRIALLALLAAFVLGAVHALSPGHGKTIVGAYLIGSRGTPRHAAFLGLTVTVTHTLGVFVLGFATLAASRFLVPERLFPILSLLSGLLILGMGVFLLAARWQAVRHLWLRPAAAHGNALKSGHVATHSHHAHDHDHDHDHGHGHDHHHDHGHDHHHEGGLAFRHSHEGSVHSHAPPGTDGEPVTWRSLLTLGISGGLVPCPSAMVLLLAAVALNRTAVGLLLVVAFSLGLAATLTAVGIAFLYARNRFREPVSTSRWPQLLPALSAVAITLVGGVLSIAAVQSVLLVR
jgi:nickel/cobalt transporter (NicO) family protein